jgi:hypothetical protein
MLCCAFGNFGGFERVLSHVLNDVTKKQSSKSQKEKSLKSREWQRSRVQREVHREQTENRRW